MRKLLVGLALAALAMSCNPSEPPEDLAATPTPADDGGAAGGSLEECEDRELAEPEEQDEMTDEKPEVEVPDGAPPCELVIQDIVEGDGKEAKEGDTVAMRYVGVSWSTGEEFDSNWDEEGLELSLMQVIAGWQQGIPGMKEGGQRRLIIPPDLAYAQNPPPGSNIAAGETLIFEVGLVKVAS
jgi:peptidylprolyl isomerase